MCLSLDLGRNRLRVRGYVRVGDTATRVVVEVALDVASYKSPILAHV